MDIFLAYNYISTFVLCLFIFISFLEIERKLSISKILFLVSLLFTTFSVLINYRLLLSSEYANNLNIILSFSLLISFFLYFISCLFDFSFIRMRFFFIPYFFIIFMLIEFMTFSKMLNVKLTFINNDFLFFHIILSFLAYSFLSISAISSVAIYLQEKNLKLSNYNSNFFFNSLPSVYDSEKITIKLLYLTQIFLLFSLFTGFYYSSQVSNNLNDFFNEKSILSCITFLLICLLLSIRFFFGISGKKVFNLVLLSYFLINLAYFGIKLL